MGQQNQLHYILLQVLRYKELVFKDIKRIYI